MDQAKQFVEESSAISSYQTTWDVITDYMMYVLFFLGLFVSAIYLSHGGDIMYCDPVIQCPSTSDAYWKSLRIQPTVRSKCETYKNASSAHFNKSFSLVVHFLSTNQYKYVNSYCSESLLGFARFTYPVIVAVSVVLFCLGRLWYVLPVVKTHLKNLDLMVEEAGKLDGIDMVKELYKHCKDLKISEQDTNYYLLVSLCTTTGDTPTQENNEETYLLRDIKVKQTSEQEPDRNAYFKKRENLTEVASKFRAENILKLFSFRKRVQQWKDNTQGYIHFCYPLLTFFVRLPLGIYFFAMGITKYCTVYMKYDHKEGKEIECKVKFRYDIIYDQILCTYNAQPFLWLICIVPLVVPGIYIVCCLGTFFQTGWKFLKREPVQQTFLKREPLQQTLSDFYWVLLEMRNKFKSEQIRVCFQEHLTDLEERQIETDVRSPFTKLELEKGGCRGLPTYTVKGPVHGIPSCLFTEKIDEQDWCLEINNSLTLKDSDFKGFKYLKGLKEMKLLNCHGISCDLMLEEVKTLQIKSSVLQKPLKIGHEGQPGNLWQIPNLTDLKLVDIRPFKSLSLELNKITELWLSEMVVHKFLQYYGERNFPDLSVLSFCNCKFEDTALCLKSGKLTKLSITECGIQQIPTLKCETLHTLDLTKNNIKVSDRKAGSTNAGSQTKLPKLEVLILTENCIGSLDNAFFDNLQLKDGLNKFDITQNPLDKSSILSDASLLFFFATKRFANRLIDAEKYGDYQIENEELIFPSFKELEDASGQAVFYCGIKHDQVRQRMMLYMTCAAQLLNRKGFNVYDEYQFQRSTSGIFTDTSQRAKADKLRKVKSFHVYLAIGGTSVINKSTIPESEGTKSISENLSHIADVVKGVIGRDTKFYVVIDFEYDTSQEVQGQVKELFSGATKIFYNTLQKQRSLVRETALTLKRRQDDDDVDSVLFD